MNKCPNCGSDTKEGAKFCTTCGYQLIRENVDNTTKTKQTVNTDKMKEVSMNY
ncbi:zinc-ribbon domain-containing protein [Ligilactobacillus salivarius]|nr:zinc ribbon domain-containing protein [Ligilactobacillus salivarius]